MIPLTFRNALDKVVVNERWRRKWPNIIVSTLSRYRSDHNPILTECCDLSSGRGRRKKISKVYKYVVVGVGFASFVSFVCVKFVSFVSFVGFLV